MNTKTKFKLALLIAGTGLILNLPYLIEVPKQVEAKTPDYNVYKPCWEKYEGQDWKDICTKVVDVPSQPKESTPATIAGVEQWRSLVAKYFPANQITNCLMVMRGESGGRASAIGHNNNGSTDYGLMQINSIHTKKVGGNLNSLLDPETNIRVASEIYKQQGNWSAWVVARKLNIK